MVAFLSEVPSASICFGYVGISTVLVLLACFSPKAVHRRIIGIAFLLVSFVTLVVVRLPTFLYDRPINPDEALMAANAMRARSGWLNWDIVDPLTAGPIDSMVLAWPRFFGLDITFFNVRLTGVIVLGLSLTLLYDAVRRTIDERVAMAAVLPAYTFLIFVSFYDFVHYSSELMTVLLLSIGIFGTALHLTTGRNLPLLAAAFAAGCVPFAKLQGAPLAVLVGIVVLACAVLAKPGPARAQLARSAGVVLAACLPALIFLLPLALSGGFDDFIKSYFTQQALRADWEDWRDLVPGLVTSTSFGSLLMSYGVLLISGLAAAWLLRYPADPKARRRAVVMLAFALAALAVSYFVVATPARPFPHYLLLGLPALVLVGAAGCPLLGFARTPPRRTAPFLLGLTTAFALVALLPGLARERVGDQYWSFNWNDGLLLQGRAFEAPRPLQWLRPTGDASLLCWGWRPECYVDSALPPATREATNENQLYWTDLKGYFRERFMAELRQDDPEFIIDVVSPASFYFHNANDDGIARFPELATFVNEGYRLYSTAKDPDRCPRLYLKKDKAAQLDASRILFASISASASKEGHDVAAIDDGIIFESCVDYWAAPDQTGGRIDIAFSEAAPVRRILVLNTRGGREGDRASVQARIALRFKDQRVWTADVTLEMFPRWTEVDIGDNGIQADSMTIEVLSFRGKGGGLNEVKVYRD